MQLVRVRNDTCTGRLLTKCTHMINGFADFEAAAAAALTSAGLGLPPGFMPSSAAAAAASMAAAAASAASGASASGSGSSGAGASASSGAAAGASASGASGTR